MPISYTTIPRPSVPSYTPVSELYDDILDESGVSILDESSGKLKSEQDSWNLVYNVMKVFDI